MSTRPRTILAGLTVVVVTVVLVVLLTGGGEDGKGKVVRGEAGYPLRGPLAGDEGAIAGAVSAWRHAKARSDEAASRDSTQRYRPGPDDDVAALWAGKTDETHDVAMLESDGYVAEATRFRDGDWRLSGQTWIGRLDTAGVPIGAGDSVLVPARGQWRYVDASRYSGGLEDAGDGLFTGGGTGSAGFLVPTVDSRSIDDSISIYVAGVGARSLDRASFARLEKALASGSARAVYMAIDEGERDFAEQREATPQRQDSHMPEALSIVWTGGLPGHPHAAVVAQGRSPAQNLALGYAERADDRSTGDRRDESSVLLGSGSKGLAGSNREGTVLGGAYLRIDDFPYLVLAGTGVETLHAIAGDRELSRPGPVAIVDTRAFADADDPPDTIVYGRAANGDVVAPLGPG